MNRKGIIDLFTTLDLENFLKEHEGEWWSPSEIGLELVVDPRTVKSRIRRLKKMTLKGWVLELAERGDRLYVVRMVSDVEISRNLIEDEVSDVEVDRTRNQISSKKEQTLDNYFPI